MKRKFKTLLLLPLAVLSGCAAQLGDAGYTGAINQGQSATYGYTQGSFMPTASKQLQTSDRQYFGKSDQQYVYHAAVIYSSWFNSYVNDKTDNVTSAHDVAWKYEEGHWSTPINSSVASAKDAAGSGVLPIMGNSDNNPNNT